jgi:hypothetical protein
MTSTIDKMSAKTAGYMYHSPAWSLPQMAKAAPIIGPKRNPRLKATPIRAIPFPLVAGVDTSVMMAVDRLTFPVQYIRYYLSVYVNKKNSPLDIPPIILAKTKIAKLLERTHSR